MTAKKIGIAIALGGALCLAPAAARAQQAPTVDRFQPFQTVWSGVYDKDEAEKGRQTASRLCDRCHGPELKGADGAPRLTGASFFDRWHDLLLLDVVAYIQSAMPRDHGFFVPAESTREIVSFMLQQSGVPAGSQPMSKDVTVLGEILISRAPAAR